MSDWLNIIKNVITGRTPVSQQKKLVCVSVGIAIVHAIMLVMFVIFDVWPMIVYNGIVVAYYTYVLRTVHSGNIITGYIMTFIEIAVQVIFGTFMLGWNVGFFMYILAIIPLFFYLNLLNDNYHRSLLIPLFASIGAGLVFLASYVVSMIFKPGYHLSEGRIHLLFIYNSLLAIFFLAVMSHLFLIERRFSLMAMTEQNQRLDMEAREDPLTGLINRRSMVERLQKAMDSAKSNGKVFSLIMADIDFFKRINDTYGHDFGDEALRETSKIFKDSVGENDSVCRWGGEEFLSLIGGTREEAAKVAERIRACVEENMYVRGDEEIRFTITLGVTAYKPGLSIDRLIAQADENLYFGKENGRNQVVSEDHDFEEVQKMQKKPDAFEEVQKMQEKPDTFEEIQKMQKKPDVAGEDIIRDDGK